MDWPSHLYPFLQPNSFKCVGSDNAKDNQSSAAIQVHDSKNGLLAVDKRILSDQKQWDNWFQDLADRNLFSEDDFIAPSLLPKNGVCILFIPRAADIQPTIEPSLTDLPIDEDNWERISKAFYLLPGHIIKTIMRKVTSITSFKRIVMEEESKTNGLWMHAAMANTSSPGAFALTSTHIDYACFTFAIMIGCSEKQIERTQYLVENAEDAIGHPLLMLGVCTELHLDRLRSLVDDKVTKCLITTRAFEAIFRTRKEQQQHHDKRPKEEITWDVVGQFRTHRNECRRAEEEVKTTRRQILKALPADIRSLVEGSESPYESNMYNGKKNDKGKGDSNAATSASSNESEFNKDDEVESMFAERFADIFSQFEGLVADCQTSVEEMSFTVDLIRSELARQEAKNSAQEAKISTVIAFVAMLFLPMTSIATIFAMPIFQYSNDWRDWRYRQVQKGNSTGPQGTSTTTSNGADQPVFSGYFFIYLGVSTALTLLTIEGWWRFTSREVEGRKGKHWFVYLLHSLLHGSWIHMKIGLQKLRSLWSSCVSLGNPNKLQKQAQPEKEQSEIEPELKEKTPLDDQPRTSSKDSSASNPKTLLPKSPPTTPPKTSLSSPLAPPALPPNLDTSQSNLTSSWPDLVKRVVSSSSNTPLVARSQDNGNKNQRISAVSSKDISTVPSHQSINITRSGTPLRSNSPADMV